MVSSWRQPVFQMFQRNRMTETEFWSTARQNRSFSSLSVHRHQVAFPMFYRLAAELHAGLRRQDKTVAQALGAWQPLSRFLRSILSGNSLLGAEGHDADVPLAFFLGNETGEGPDRVLADDIGRGAVVLGPPAAPEVNNVTAAARLHKWDDVLRAQESPAQIGLNDTVPEILAHETDTRPAGNAPVKVGNDTGVVDQNVDSSVAIDDLVDHAAYLVLVPHVRGQSPHLELEIAQLAQGFVQSFYVYVNDNHAAAGLSDSVSRVTTDSFSPARNDNDFSLHHDSVSSLRLCGRSFGQPGEGDGSQELSEFFLASLRSPQL